MKSAGSPRVLHGNHANIHVYRNDAVTDKTLKKKMYFFTASNEKQLWQSDDNKNDLCGNNTYEFLQNEKIWK